MVTVEDVRGIPEFWLTAMKNVDHIADMIQVKKFPFLVLFSFGLLWFIVHEERMKIWPDNVSYMKYKQLYSFIRQNIISFSFQEHDEPILKNLTSIDLKFIDEEKTSVDSSEESKEVNMVRNFA